MYIDEEQADIIGIWCCNNCCKLSDPVDLLYTHMHELKRDVATLINYARAFESIRKSHMLPTCEPRVFHMGTHVFHIKAHIFHIFSQNVINCPM